MLFVFLDVCVDVLLVTRYVDCYGCCLFVLLVFLFNCLNCGLSYVNLMFLV